MLPQTQHSDGYIELITCRLDKNLLKNCTALMAIFPSKIIIVKLLQKMKVFAYMNICTLSNAKLF